MLTCLKNVGSAGSSFTDTRTNLEDENVGSAGCGWCNAKSHDHSPLFSPPHLPTFLTLDRAAAAPRRCRDRVRRRHGAKPAARRVREKFPKFGLTRWIPLRKIALPSLSPSCKRAHESLVKRIGESPTTANDGSRLRSWVPQEAVCRHRAGLAGGWWGMRGVWVSRVATHDYVWRTPFLLYGS